MCRPRRSGRTWRTPGATRERCLDCARQGRTQEQLRLLSAHRRLLLDAVHRCEKQITCLDYLVFQIEREERAGQSGPPPGRKKPTKRGTF